jgi:hypothetical protein
MRTALQNALLKGGWKNISEEKKGRRLKQLLDYRKGISSYCDLKEQAVVRTSWKIGC